MEELLIKLDNLMIRQDRAIPTAARPTANPAPGPQRRPAARWHLQP